MQNPQNFPATPSCAALPDKDLYALCKQYGKNARKWTRKFAFLLPEVLKRGLHRKYGYQGINEFAAKLCGMSAEVVTRVLGLHGKLVDKPLIWGKFEVYGWTKLMLVARVVEVDTQKFWIDKLERLTYRGLAEYVQVWKAKNLSCASTSENNEKLFEEIESTQLTLDSTCESGDKTEGKCADYGLQKTKNTGALKFVTENLGDNCAGSSVENLDEQTAMACKTYKKFKFNLDAETEFRLKRIKQQLEKERGAVTFGETVKYLLEKLEELEGKELSGENIGEDKQDVTESRVDDGNKIEDSNAQSFGHKSPTSHARAKSKEELETKEQTGKNTGDSAKSKKAAQEKHISCCAYPGCNEPYDEKHHPFRASLSPNNKNLASLCRKHHQLVHSGLVENEQQSPEKWRLRTEEMPEQLMNYFKQTFTERVDSAVRGHIIDG